MIFGKTWTEQQRRCDAKDKALRNRWMNWFAWRPVILEDGRWAWMEYVDKKYLSTVRTQHQISDALIVYGIDPVYRAKESS